MSNIALFLALSLLAGCAAQPTAVTQPAALTVRATASYPAVARRNGIQGVVALRVQVLASGLPGEVEILKSSGSALLDASAVDIARKSTFAAARTAVGDPVDSWLPMPVRFSLE